MRPRAVVGFGGYPTVPPLVAASLLGIPSVLHEQNAVMGRANRFLSSRVTLIACGFPDLKEVDAATRAKTRFTGNPVRPAVVAAAATPYPDFAGRRIRLLVTGGSQGARVMADVVPAALALLSADERQWIRLTQQARGEDMARVAAACARMKFPVEIAEFFDDLPARIADAHLVVGRAGASTVSELAVIGRPSVLVPFPHALDQDQAANAAVARRLRRRHGRAAIRLHARAAGEDPSGGAGVASEAHSLGSGREIDGRRGCGRSSRGSRSEHRNAILTAPRRPARPSATASNVPGAHILGKENSALKRRTPRQWGLTGRGKATPAFCCSRFSRRLSVHLRLARLALCDRTPLAACLADGRQFSAFSRQARLPGPRWPARAYAGPESCFAFRAADGERPVQRLKA